MLRVRTGLLLAWFVLIASLLWDPLTPILTHPDNVASPFRLRAASIAVQDRQMAQTPYAMGNRIFWTMLLPLVPIYVLVFGHEAWRRICPLSQFSQIPRRWGWARKLAVLDRKSGGVNRVLALVPNPSWLRANHFYVQFGLLSAGIAARLLFANSDRIALLLVFLLVLGCAFLVGLLYGGKTWCNYFCPISVMQKIYSGPGGLLESKSHISRADIKKSICRLPTATGSRSACVGCTTNCPDVDLESSYWKMATAQSTRFVYYGFFGLVVAFHLYYLLYAGNWWYYFSGIWTHEPDQLGDLLTAGFYVDGRAIPIPKLIAVPLFFLACIFGSYVLFAGAESLYARVREWRGKPLSLVRRRHHMLTLAAFMSFNLYYVFAGRSNILLFPNWAIHIVDATIVFVSALWLYTSLGRDADLYRRENLAVSLREQLARLGFRAEEVLEGRTLDTLTADEVYILAKTLPNFTDEQKRQAYRAIVKEVLESGEVKSADSLQLLSDLRHQLGLSEADHREIIEALGIQDPQLLNPDIARSTERQLRRSNYRRYVQQRLERCISEGAKPSDYFARADVLESLMPIRIMCGVSDEDHNSVISEIIGDLASIVAPLERLVETIKNIEIMRFSLAGDERAEAVLARHALLGKQKAIIREATSLLAAISDQTLVRRFGQTIYALLGSDAGPALARAANQLPEEVRAAFLERTADAANCSYFEVLAGRRDAASVWRDLVDDDDHCLAAVALSGLAGIAPRMACDLLATLDARRWEPEWLYDEIAEAVRHGGCATVFEHMVTILSVDMFAELPLAALAEMSLNVEQIHLHAGDYVCRSGEDSDRMFVLQSGETQAWLESAGAPTALGKSMVGAVFGELGIITGEKRAASIQVTSPEATLLAIPRTVVHRLLDRDLRVTRDMLSIVSGYLQETLTQVGSARATAAT